MTTTTNLGLKKPENSDYADVSVLNENMDKLDETIPNLTGNALKEASTKSTPADDDGVVIVDSTDSSKIKRILWSKIKALFAPKTHASQHSASGSDPVTPESIGAVKKSGDTMTGNLTIQNASYPDINLENTGSGSVTKIRNIAHRTQIMSQEDGSNYRTLTLYDKSATTNLADILQIQQIESGVEKAVYKVIHTGNLSDLGIAKIETGSYVGTGVKGEANPNSLTFGFIPKVVFVVPDTSTQNGNGMILVQGASTFGGFGTFYATTGTVTDTKVLISWSGKSVSWYCPTNYEGEVYQQNESGVTYRYVAFG